MSTMITEVYEAFKAANVDDDKAIAAATAIPAKANLATTEDLLKLGNRLDRRMDSLESSIKEEMLKLETRLDKRIDSLETRLDKRIDSLETRLDKRIDEVRLDLQTGLLKLENKIIIWMGGMLVVAVSVLAVLMKIL